ncbi:MAG: hypothetical protein Unbinned5081contig1001_59 [Prokaryotic dsDNA virus sp.]|nr:MAG: hypothetical protein Unbinned5081contig1001_59 [Prokaryotic dsDNA virus sp.]|tara:strand:+ start:8830 stop:10167 length:1338 start_codon:yes stop_codon:yes gene_type:complete
MATLSKDTRSMTTTLGSDSAGPFNLGFRIFDTDGFEVFVNEVQTTDFTISASFSNGYDDTATITFGTELDSGDVVDVYGDMVSDREADLPSGGMNLIAAANSELPRYAAMISEIRDKFKRVIMAPKGDMGYLPSAASRSGKWLGFDAEGDWVVGTPADPGDVTISSFAETLLDDTSGWSFLYSLGFDNAAINNAFGDTADQIGNIDDTSLLHTGFHHILSGATGTKPTTGAFALIVARETSSLIWQIAVQGSNMWVRSNTGSWSAWEKVNQSGHETIVTKTASASSSLDFTEFDSSRYRGYIFYPSNLIPATDGTSLICRTSATGGAPYDSGASDYAYAFNEHVAGGTDAQGSSAAAASAIIASGVGSAAGEDGISGRIEVIAPDAATKTQFACDLTYFESGGFWVRCNSGLVRLSQAEVDAVSFQFLIGNIASGAITMVGIRKS